MLQNAGRGVKRFPALNASVVDSRIDLCGMAKGIPVSTRVVAWPVLQWFGGTKGEEIFTGSGPPYIFFFDFPKIFILNNLLVGYRPGSGQNIEPQGLTRKTLQNKDLLTFQLTSLISSPIFSVSVGSPNILILNDLVETARGGSAQNLEPQ
jgi:hypothetical protein